MKGIIQFGFLHFEPIRIYNVIIKKFSVDLSFGMH